jgi:acetyltransferase-like isoleucine patch superfamily enzyme
MIIMLMPASRFKNAILRLLHHQIGRKSKIGICLFINVSKISIDENVQIGSLNSFRNLKVLRLHSNSSIGNLNWLSASAVLTQNGANGSIEMKESSVITNRHYLDLSGGLIIGARSAIWGVRSTLMTHGIEIESWLQNTILTEIGDDVVIGSNAIICPGVKISKGSYFGMGCLIAGTYSSPNTLYINQKSTSRRKLNNRDAL